MRFTEDTLDYLKGTKYINALHVAFQMEEEDRQYRTQIDLLCELSQGKKIIHVGCVDHNIETVRHKIQRKKWLHSRLCDRADRCHGIDIEEQGILAIQEELGFKDTSCVNIFSDDFKKLVAEEKWDYLLIPEVLEHIDDPATFLRSIANNYSDSFSKVILTVPNGFAWDNVKYAKKQMEVINSDHRFWFTPYTIAKAVFASGMHVEKILMCRHGTISKGSLIRKIFYKKYPLLRNDILCIASF